MKDKRKTSDLNLCYGNVVEHLCLCGILFLWSFSKLTGSSEATPNLKLTSCDVLISPIRHVFH